MWSSPSRAAAARAIREGAHFTETRTQAQPHKDRVSPASKWAFVRMATHPDHVDPSIDAQDRNEAASTSVSGMRIRQLTFTLASRRTRSRERRIRWSPRRACSQPSVPHSSEIKDHQRGPGRLNLSCLLRQKSAGITAARSARSNGCSRKRPTRRSDEKIRDETDPVGGA
jgi:hypothetical protein